MSFLRNSFKSSLRRKNDRCDESDATDKTSTASRQKAGTRATNGASLSRSNTFSQTLNRAFTRVSFKKRKAMETSKSPPSQSAPSTPEKSPQSSSAEETGPAYPPWLTPRPTADEHPTPVWMHAGKDDKHPSVGLAWNCLFDIFGISPDTLIDDCRRKDKRVLVAGLEAVLIHIKAATSGSVKGIFNSRKASSRASPPNPGDPMVFPATCVGKRLRVGVFNPYPAYTDELLGDHYFVPYIRANPSTHSRYETLSLPLGTLAAECCHQLLHHKMPISDEACLISYYPAVLLSSCGPVPDFKNQDVDIIDSPYIKSGFVPGVLVVIPDIVDELAVLSMSVSIAKDGIEAVGHDPTIDAEPGH